MILINYSSLLSKTETFHLIYRWDPNKYHRSSQSIPESNNNKRVLHIPQTPKQEPHHQIQINALPRAQVLLSTANNSLQHNSFVLQIHTTLTGTTIPCRSGRGSNGNEGGTLHSTKLLDWSHAIGWFSVILRALVERKRGFIRCIGAVGVFYNPCRQGVYWTIQALRILL